MRYFFFVLLLVMGIGQALANCSINIHSTGLGHQRWKKGGLLKGSSEFIPLWGSSKELSLNLNCTNGETPGMRFTAATPMLTRSNGVDGKKLAAITTLDSSKPIGAFRLTLQGQGRGSRNYEIGVAKRNWDNSGWLAPEMVGVPLVLGNATSKDDVALTEQYVYKTPKSASGKLIIDAWFLRSAIIDLSGPTSVTGRVTIQLSYL